MLQPNVLFDKGTAFYVNDYSDKIRQAVVGLNLEFIDIVATPAVTVKGTSYKKGLYILLGKTEEELSWSLFTMALCPLSQKNICL